VQTTNLQVMYAIRLGLERDMAGTCRRFGLHAEQAQQLRSLAPERLWAAVCAVRHTSLFVARSDVVSLLHAPPELVATLAAARPAVPSSPLRL
jgi:hypothetical protein